MHFMIFFFLEPLYSLFYHNYRHSIVSSCRRIVGSSGPSLSLAQPSPWSTVLTKHPPKVLLFVPFSDIITRPVLFRLFFTFFCLDFVFFPLPSLSLILHLPSFKTLLHHVQQLCLHCGFCQNSHWKSPRIARLSDLLRSRSPCCQG